MGRRCRARYAIWKGDECLAIGTAEELARKFGVTKKTILVVGQRGQQEARQGPQAQGGGAHMSDLDTLKTLQRRLRWEDACERNARPNRPPKSHKIGRPVADGFCYSLSDWEVLEAYQMWDGTYPGAERLAPRYHVSYRTLLRAFKRMEEKWSELHERQS